MDWNACKKAFYVDGSLRDIYVQNTTVADWDKFLEMAASLKTASFIDGEPKQLPAQVSEIFKRNGDVTFSLKITIGNVNLHCHFFTAEEIELDIDPREVTSQQELNAVVDVLVDMGKALNKDVVLADENSPDSWWLLFEASTEKLNFRSAE